MLAFPVPALPPRLRSIGPSKSGELYTFASPEPAPVNTPTKKVVFGKQGGGVKVDASCQCIRYVPSRPDASWALTVNPGPPVFPMSVPLGANIVSVPCGGSLMGPYWQPMTPVQLHPAGRSRCWIAAANVPK